MPSVEERLATLEGRIQEHATFMADVRGNMTESLRDFRHEVDRLFQGVDRQFQELRGDVDRRFHEVDRQFKDVDRRFQELGADMNRRFDRVERHFFWMFGAMMTGFTIVMAGLIGGVFRLM